MAFIHSPIHDLACTPACRGGVGEVLPCFAPKRAVMRKQVFNLDFAETQQGCFRVCGLLTFGLAPGGLNA
jgi:hypothetical protein